MGECIFCGKPVGFLRKHHKECTKTFEIGKETVASLMQLSLLKNTPLETLQKQLDSLSKTHFLDKQNLKNALVRGWESVVDKAFEDGVLTEAEESFLNNLAYHFSLAPPDLDKNGAYTRLLKGAVLRDILDGKNPKEIKIQGGLPFNLQKNEKLIWAFQDVDYYEQQTRREFKGGHQGLSIRVAKGVYYRFGAFKGRPVEKTETVYIDRGLLGVTNKHIYFAGGKKTFRIRYNKIISFTPYSDGIGLHRDAATAKLQTFVTGDGWFTYNLLSNVSQL